MKTLRQIVSENQEANKAQVGSKIDPKILERRSKISHNRTPSYVAFSLYGKVTQGNAIIQVNSTRQLEFFS